MTSPVSRLAAFALALLLAGCAGMGGPRDAGPRPAAGRVPLILISIDGFRADYLDRGHTPTLSAMAAEGARARAMRPSFPSVTFPNHYTLVTGRRPDRHGVVANTMEDPALGRFRIRDAAAVTDRRWWEDATPLWVTAKQQGLRTATMFWPGSEAAIQGVRPDAWRKYDYDLPAAARVDTVLGWLGQPVGTRPDFVTLYFEAVDSAGHEHGPDSPEVTEALRATDAALLRLRHGLQARGVEANIVVVSDHGMAAANTQILLDDIVDVAKIRTVTEGAYVGIQPGPGFDAATEAALLKPAPHHQCWRKGELPARFDFGRHRRVPAVVCVTEPGWTLATKARSANPDKGEHGHDPAHPSMAALFVAQGPAFRRGVTVRDFDNVDVYPLSARVLGVRPEPNDGDLRELRRALR
jgi:predicted AlkP superfamily pyrophosphatase or phosphodiesterase